MHRFKRKFGNSIITLKNLNINSLTDDINKASIHLLVKELKKKLRFRIESLVVNFVSEDEITKLNIEYLGHHYSTDIITFNYSGSTKNLDGEIFISFEDAACNARKFKVPFEEEILRLVIHGILHLLGYDDINEKEHKIMKDLENKLLNKYKLPLLK